MIKLGDIKLHTLPKDQDSERRGLNWRGVMSLFFLECGKGGLVDDYLMMLGCLIHLCIMHATGRSLSGEGWRVKERNRWWVVGLGRDEWVFGF